MLYSNPQLDRMIDQVKVEMNSETRLRLAREALLLANADVAYVPLYRRAVVWAMRPNIRAVVIPNDNLELRWVDID